MQQSAAVQTREPENPHHPLRMRLLVHSPPGTETLLGAELPAG
jgi:hypothetical protein